MYKHKIIDNYICRNIIFDKQSFYDLDIIFTGSNYYYLDLINNRYLFRNLIYPNIILETLNKLSIEIVGNYLTDFSLIKENYIEFIPVVNEPITIPSNDYCAGGYTLVKEIFIRNNNKFIKCEDSWSEYEYENLISRQQELQSYYKNKAIKE